MIHVEAAGIGITISGETVKNLRKDSSGGDIGRCRNKQSKATPEKGSGTAVLFFFGWLNRPEAAIEHQIVNNLKTSRQKERHVQQRCVGE